MNRRTQEEVVSLKQRNCDLSLQLSQARQEADEFYKNSVERNIDAVSLGNQVRIILDFPRYGAVYLAAWL